MPLHDWTRVDATYFRDFHLAWIAELRRALNKGLLPPEYYALAEQTTPPVNPDVLTLTRPTPIARQSSRPKKSPSSGGGLATTTDRPPRVQFAAQGRKRQVSPPAQRRVAIRHASGHQLVAVIEIVSKGNKSSQRDFRQFVNKSVDLLDQGIHLLVIDPYPPTARDRNGLHAAIWKALVRERFTPPAGKPLTLASYVAQGADEYAAYVQPVAVGDRLPDMPLFLTPEAYVNVPLESTYREAWDGFPEALRPLLEDEPVE